MEKSSWLFGSSKQLQKASIWKHIALTCWRKAAQPIWEQWNLRAPQLICHPDYSTPQACCQALHSESCNCEVGSSQRTDFTAYSARHPNDSSWIHQSLAEWQVEIDQKMTWKWILSLSEEDLWVTHWWEPVLVQCVTHMLLCGLWCDGYCLICTVANDTTPSGWLFKGTQYTRKGRQEEGRKFEKKYCNFSSVTIIHLI